MDFSESTLIYLKKCGVDFHFQKYPQNPRPRKFFVSKNRKIHADFKIFTKSTVIRDILLSLGIHVDFTNFRGLCRLLFGECL